MKKLLVLLMISSSAMGAPASVLEPVPSTAEPCFIEVKQGAWISAATVVKITEQQYSVDVNNALFAKSKMENRYITHIELLNRDAVRLEEINPQAPRILASIKACYKKK